VSLSLARARVGTHLHIVTVKLGSLLLMLIFQHNVTEFSIDTTEMRLNPHYVVWFRNLIQFTASSLTPLILLTYWNVGTVIRINRRNKNLAQMRIQNNPINETGTPAEGEEVRIFILLFVKYNNDIFISQRQTL